MVLEALIPAAYLTISCWCYYQFFKIIYYSCSTSHHFFSLINLKIWLDLPRDIGGSYICHCHIEVVQEVLWLIYGAGERGGGVVVSGAAYSP